MKKLIKTDYDDFTGITEEFWFDEATNEVTIRRLMDIREDAAAVARERNATPTTFTDVDKGIFRAADIPLIEVERWETEHGFKWNETTPKEKREWLNRQENKHWKTRNVRL